MNEEKMIAVLARIEDERAMFARHVPGAVGFNMDNWFARTGCGTTACLAGHAVLMEGYVMATDSMCSSPTNGAFLMYVENLGADILGLSEYDAAGVFYLETLDDVYEWVAEKMHVEESVLRDKVQANRGRETK